MPMVWSWAEKRFIYFPQSGVASTPDEVGLNYSEVRFQTSDGLTLSGWFVPAPAPYSRRTQTWLWFHGNGGNIGTRVSQLERVHSLLGVHQLIFDYRGYGRSGGKPSERGTYLDARAALYYLRGRADVDPRRIVYFGHSLGAAIAIELATAHSPYGMALISPFSSIADMAKITVKVPMAWWFVRGHYNSMERIRRVHTPLLILHSEGDDVVPFSQGMKLYQAANRPKRFVALRESTHNDIGQGDAGQMAQALQEFRDGLATKDVARGYTPPTISTRTSTRSRSRRDSST